MQLVFPSSTPGIELAGTLSLPEKEPKAVVLLLSGSGPQDRYESIAGHQPFKVLAEFLVQQGYGVLQWDDRGMGESQGDYLQASADILVDDLCAAAKAAMETTQIDRLLLLGHSQGCLVATAGACHPLLKNHVDGLVLLAGIGRPGREVLMDQHVSICKAEGFDADVIEESLAAKVEIFDLLAEAERRIQRRDSPTHVLPELREQLKTLMLAGDQIDDLSEQAQEDLEFTLDDLMEWEWRFLLTVDPAHDLAQVSCPVLLMAGDKDSQVDAENDLEAQKLALEQGGNQAVTVILLPDHNHLFQECVTGALSEYETIHEIWSEKALQHIKHWLQTGC